MSQDTMDAEREERERIAALLEQLRPAAENVAMWRSRLLYPTESKRAAEEILQRVVVESADFASAFLALLADLNPSPSERTEP